MLRESPSAVGSPSLVSSCADSYCVSQYCLQLHVPRKKEFCLCHLRARLLLCTVLCVQQLPCDISSRSGFPASQLTVWRLLFYPDVRGISHDSAFPQLGNLLGFSPITLPVVQHTDSRVFPLYGITLSPCLPPMAINVHLASLWLFLGVPGGNIIFLAVTWEV